MRAMRATVLLFDIDGTLISTGGAGRRSMERAFAQRTGHENAWSGFSFAGMTDRAIVRAGLVSVGHPVDEDLIDAILSAYVELLAVEMTVTKGARIHPGMVEALDAAAERSGFAIGLGTGNIRAGARAKLGHLGLYDRFAFGGFGCDHELRDAILRVGAERGAAALGTPRDACRVVVIGDTPKDIAAARAIGAESIAVATGTYDLAALRACAPTWAFDDLTAPGALAVLLDGASAAT
jgi:phosphoglycolate phosphatase-like HAD superfamily hydrolase